MTSTLKVVCVIAALLGGVGASGAAASPMLTTDDMSTLRGGACGGGPSYGWYCYPYVCGSGPEECKYWEFQGQKYCSPGDPEVGCDNNKRNKDRVYECKWAVDNDDPCTPGELTYCGHVYDCLCVKGIDFRWRCAWELVSHGSYLPCE